MSHNGTVTYLMSFQNHTHAIYRKISGCKNQNFHWKNLDINNFSYFLAQNIDCGYSLESHTLELPQRGDSNEYPQSMLWIKNRKIRFTPAYPSFTI